MSNKLKVWWVPQVPGKPFEAPVSSVEEGVKVMDVLADYDRFQFENRIKPDYCNAGGLLMFDPEDGTDGPDGSWCEWFYDDGDGWWDDPREYLESKGSA